MNRELNHAIHPLSPPPSWSEAMLLDVNDGLKIQTLGFSLSRVLLSSMYELDAKNIENELAVG